MIESKQSYSAIFPNSKANNSGSGVDIRISSALAGGGGGKLDLTAACPPGFEVGFYSSLPESNYCVNSV